MGSAKQMAARQAAALQRKQSKREKVPVSKNKQKDTEDGEEFYELDQEEEGGNEEVEALEEEEEEEEEEDEQDEEERVTEVSRNVVAQKKKKALHIESKVLIMFILF